MPTPSSAAAETDDTIEQAEPRLYECAVLFPYGISQKEDQQAIKEVEGFFEEVGAKLVAKDAWGRRGIAYPIKGAMEANVIIYHYEMDPSRLKEVDQNLRIHRGVLRHMFVKPPKDYQIVKYSELYEKWLKERETREQVVARQKEEKLQDRVAKKAQRQVKLAAEQKKPTDAKPVIEKEKLTEKLEKLISDEFTDI